LLPTGLGNADGALLSPMPAGGGTTQTAVNRLVGAHSQLAEFVTAAVTLGTMLPFAPLIGLMPHATLAAVVIVYSIGLLKPADFLAILAVRRTVKMLNEAEKKYREQGIAVWLVGMSSEVFSVVEKAPLGKTPGHERMFLNLEQALAAWHDLSCKQADASSNEPTKI
jgi:MFS superfamily sulfate permease-like transporter